MDVAYVWFGTYADSMKRVRKEVTRSFMVGFLECGDSFDRWLKKVEWVVFAIFCPAEIRVSIVSKIEIKKNGQK